MGLFLRQQESRSKLQSRINKELQGKLKPTDDVKSPEVDPQFLDDNHQTTNSGMALIIIITVVIIAAIAWFLIAK